MSEAATQPPPTPRRTWRCALWTLCKAIWGLLLLIALVAAPMSCFRGDALQWTDRRCILSDGSVHRPITLEVSMALVQGKPVRFIEERWSLLSSRGYVGVGRQRFDCALSKASDLPQYEYQELNVRFSREGGFSRLTGEPMPPAYLLDSDWSMRDLFVIQKGSKETRSGPRNTYRNLVALPYWVLLPLLASPWVVAFLRRRVRKKPSGTA